MIAERTILRGTLQNGVIVPERRIDLPEGTQVEIRFSATDLTPELQAELHGWEQASAESWSLIDKWEAEEAE